MKQNIQKALHALLALMLILTSVSIPVQANDDPAAAEQNIALNKPTNTSGGQGERAVDGDLSTYWDGGVYPGELLVDLEGYYDVSRITVIPYYGGSRYYHYEVYVSDDGFTYDLVGRKDSDEPQTSEGETYEFASRTVKYVKVVMTYNSANPSIHINELQVFGTENTDYEPPETPAEDPNDPLNIAYGKPTRSTANSGFTQLAVDGQNCTAWSGEDYPKYVDVDLMRNYDITSINVCMPQGSTQFAYTVYGSVDGVHFTTIAEMDMHAAAADGDTFTFEDPLTYRVIRVNVTGNSNGEGANSMISEIRVYGSESTVPTVETRESLNLTSYEDWLKENYQVDVDALKDENGHYDIQDTFDDEDVIAEVNGVIRRILGEEYINWFTFELRPSQTGKD
ncbi:MAG TPA: discoidin domain-containing protein [Candidatus Merdibacter merdavium]|uniref:Discoidin domain-containing protein n=1 Tax=Candidatus Merdibacter merdavium TaxID=2838692 RepID=A0A9D2NPY8_9FIRM|nr:discoidin domain-containing protein [Candidatus Merdibacter merdavium]